MENRFNSKYPSVIIDVVPNSQNRHMQKRISVEEYYDLVHHTHKMSDLINDNDEISGDVTLTVSKLLDTVNDLETIIKTQQDTIDELKELVKSQSESITSLRNEVSNSVPNISDWDLETEGNQDINGNNVDNIMSFDMEEIE